MNQLEDYAEPCTSNSGTCRLCLRVENRLISIFDDGETSKQLRSRIRDCCPIRVSSFPIPFTLQFLFFLSSPLHRSLLFSSSFSFLVRLHVWYTMLLYVITYIYIHMVRFYDALFVYSFFIYMHIFGLAVRRRQTAKDDLSRMRREDSRYIRISRTMQKIGPRLKITIRIVPRKQISFYKWIQLENRFGK